MGRGKGQGYGRLQEVDMILYHAKSAERVIVLTFHCINGQNVFQSCSLTISRVLNFPEMGGGGRVEVSRALVAPPPATFSRTRTSDPPCRLKDLS